ncbi:hypothetical protein [Paraburkholderia adhaesiva]|uniref:hypothetical protein n=1 Tax=Paraburkholderia adhaesiva TaxID=2883244 RepID=UPI001F3C58D1|nr:hypothetical protein [Paraburkholderia adhaesiva]
MADWLESEFGAGVLVGIGGVGLLVGIGGGMEHRWLFIALSVVAMVAGTGVYCLLRFDKDARETKARRVLGLGLSP